MKLKQFQNSIGCLFLCRLATRLCIFVTMEVMCYAGVFMLMTVIQKPLLCACICSHGVRSASHFGASLVESGRSVSILFTIGNEEKVSH
jgi:hypothetical protein